VTNVVTTTATCNNDKLSRWNFVYHFILNIVPPFTLIASPCTCSPRGPNGISTVILLMNYSWIYSFMLLSNVKFINVIFSLVWALLCIFMKLSTTCLHQHFVKTSKNLLPEYQKLTPLGVPCGAHAGGFTCNWVNNVPIQKWKKSPSKFIIVTLATSRSPF
jgi:hypothetical protein